MFQIAFTTEAIEDLDSIRKFDAKRILSEIETQLVNEPATISRNRKQLRPNQLAEWELRMGEFRVFYDIIAGEQTVRIVAVGKKVGNELYVHGERYEL